MDEETMVGALSRSFGLSETSTRRLLEALDVTEFSMDAGSPDGARNEGCLELAGDDDLPDVMLEGERRDALFTRLAADALEALDEREVYIIEKRYARDDPESLANLGRCLGISRERVRQIEHGALRKMSLSIESTGFTSTDIADLVE
jgi:RNA polymerase sigma-32 factor